MPTSVWLQTRSVFDRGGQPLYRGSEETEGVSEQGRARGRL